MTQAGEPPYVSARYGAYVVSVLFLAWVMAFMDRQVVVLLLPSLKANLGVSDTQVSLIQGMAFASVYAVAGFPLGWITDHTNRRNLLVAGVAFWSLATVACGLATTFWEIVAARMAVGVGEACLGPACVSIMADYFRPAQRGRAMAVLQTGAPIGGAASLFVGGMLLSSLAQGGLAATLLPHGWAPWKAIFLVMGVPGLAVALLVATLREPPRRSHGEALPEGGPRLGLVALFRTYPGLFGLFFSTYTCVLIMNYALATWAPTVLMRIYGMTPKDTGFIYGSMQLVCSVSAGIFSGFVSDAIVRRRPLSGRMWIPLIGLPIQVGVIIAFILVTRVTIFIPVLAISTLVTTFISACWQPALQDLVPNQLRGRVAALMLMVGNVLGLGGAPTLVALVTDQVFHDEMKLQTSVGIVALAAGVLGLLLALGLPHACAAARRRGLGVPEPTAPVISASPAPVGVS